MQNQRQILRTICIISAFIPLFGTAQTVQEDIYLEIKLNIKFIKNPDNGLRPYNISNQQILETIDIANELLAPMWRGIRLYVEDISDIGWIGGYNEGPSKWYNTNFNNSALKNQFEAEASPPDVWDYNWTDFAINIYVNLGTGSAICSFPESSRVLIYGPERILTPSSILHEIGHFFDLCHTQGCSCGECDSCNGMPQPDNVDDTLFDWRCWDQDDISVNNYGVNYNQLPASLRDQVNNVFFNVMSYHDLSLRERLTEGQLDRWADAMDQYDSRRKVRYGNSWFVNSDWPGGGNGTAASPFASIYDALNSASASGDDMLYFKQTSTPYQTSVPGFIVVLNKPMTLRAMRGDGTGVWLR